MRAGLPGLGRVGAYRLVASNAILTPARLAGRAAIIGLQTVVDKHTQCAHNRGMSKPLTNKQFHALLLEYPVASIRFRDLGSMKVEVLSLTPGKRGVSVSRLGFIQLPKGT